MKKILAVILSLTFAVCMLAGCGNSGDKTTAAPSGDTAANTAAAASGETYNWTIGNVLSADQPWDIGLNYFAELLNEYSGGRITATVYSGGTLGSEIEMLQQVKDGTLDISICSTPSMSGFVDTQNYFDLPYLFKTVDSAWAVMDEWLAADRCEALVGSGFHGLGYMENGTYMIATNIRAEHPEELSGQRIRAHSSKLQCDSLEAAGAVPLSVAWGDIYTSLQNGTIDGVSGTTLTNMYGGKFYEQVKYISMTNHHFIPALTVMNEGLWNSLSAEDQEIVTKAWAEAVVYQRQVAFDYADDAKEVIKEAGVEIIDVDPDEWSEAMHSVYDTWVGTNGIEQSMIDKIQESEAQYLK